MSTISPTNGSGNQSAVELRNSSPFAKEFVADRVRRPLFYLPNFVAAADLVSMGAGTADLDEVGTSELGGIECATTESYSTLWILPDEIDLAQTIGIRVLSSDEAAASTKNQTVVATYQAVTCGTDAIVAPATAIGTAIAAKADLAANIPQWSSIGLIAASTISDTPGEDLCNWKLTWTLDTLTAIWILSAQVIYYRKFIG